MCMMGIFILIITNQYFYPSSCILYLFWLGIFTYASLGVRCWVRRRETRFRWALRIRFGSLLECHSAANCTRARSISNNVTFTRRYNQLFVKLMLPSVTISRMLRHCNTPQSIALSAPPLPKFQSMIIE